MAAFALAAIIAVALTTTSSAVTPTGSSPYTRFVWGDEFNGAAGTQPSSAKWAIKTGKPWNNSANSYTNRTANVRMNGYGQLELIARRETYTGSDGVTRPYTSGAILTKDKFHFTYGRLEARIKVPPPGRGFWSAFWTLRYPIGGEIDVLEHLGQNPSVVHTNIRSLKTDGRQYWKSANYTAPTNPTTAYHVYSMTWQPGRISWEYDGKQFRTVAPADLPSDYRWTFNEPEWIILNLALGGDYPHEPDSSTPLPAKMLIDWVRVYQ